MTVRNYQHAVTGRSVRVLEGTRMARLVEADGNWSEIKSTSKKEAGNGSGNAGGRGRSSRKKSDGGRGGKAAEPSE